MRTSIAVRTDVAMQAEATLSLRRKPYGQGGVYGCRL